MEWFVNVHLETDVHIMIVAFQHLIVYSRYSLPAQISLVYSILGLGIKLPVQSWLMLNLGVNKIPQILSIWTLAKLSPDNFGPWNKCRALYCPILINFFMICFQCSSILSWHREWESLVGVWGLSHLRIGPCVVSSEKLWLLASGLEWENILVFKGLHW